MKNKQKSQFLKLEPLVPIAISDVVITVVAAFKISPVPGALIIRAVLKITVPRWARRWEKHTPPRASGCYTNQQYKMSDKDARLDVYFPQSTETKLPVVIGHTVGPGCRGAKTTMRRTLNFSSRRLYGDCPQLHACTWKIVPHANHQLNEAYTYIEANATRFMPIQIKLFWRVISWITASSQIAALVTNPHTLKRLGAAKTLRLHN